MFNIFTSIRKEGPYIVKKLIGVSKNEALKFWGKDIILLTDEKFVESFTRTWKAHLPDLDTGNEQVEGRWLGTIITILRAESMHELYVECVCSKNESSYFLCRINFAIFAIFFPIG